LLARNLTFVKKRSIVNTLNRVNRQSPQIDKKKRINSNIAQMRIDPIETGILNRRYYPIYVSRIFSYFHRMDLGGPDLCRANRSHEIFLDARRRRFSSPRTPAGSRSFDLKSLKKRVSGPPAYVKIHS